MPEDRGVGVGVGWIEAAQVEVEIDLGIAFTDAEGSVYLGQFNFKRAAQVFQSVLDVSEESVQRSWAYYGRGQALLALDRPEEAAYLFEQAFRENESIELSPTTLFKAADAYYQAEKFEQAAGIYRQFLKRYPSHANEARGIYQLGLTLARIGFRAEALAEFERVVELYPLDDWRWSRCCDCRYLDCGKRMEKALATYSKLEKMRRCGSCTFESIATGFVNVCVGSI